MSGVVTCWEVSCPTCDAEPGKLCTTDDGRAVNVAHPDRIVAARTETMAGLGRQPPTHRGAWRDRAAEAERRTAAIDEGSAAPAVLTEDKC